MNRGAEPCEPVVMRTSSVIRRSLVATAASLIGLGMLASSASAKLGDEPIDTSSGTTSPPDLRVSAATVTPANSSEWQITYTVRNDGKGSAKASAVSFRNNDSSSLLAQRSVPVLAAGASRSETFRVPRAGACYVPVRAEADATRTTGDLLTGNNTRWVVGQSLPCASLPRYRVKATSFVAGDESNFDGAGSDEPYFIFNTVSNGAPTHEASDVFGDVDSGETRTFTPGDGCVYGGCSAGAAAPHGLGFSAQLWEKDLGHVDDTLYDTAEFFQDAGPIITMTGAAAWVGKTVEVMGHAMEAVLGWADDDLIGSRTYAMSPDYLISRIAKAGGSFIDTQRYEGAETSGGANYTLTIQVTRVA
jgi:hypothetical protein